MRIPPPTRTAIIAALLLAVPAATQAQSTLAGRMRAFLAAVESGHTDSVAAFFPRRGDLTWRETLRESPGGRPGVGVWRFSGAEARRAIDGGPLCMSFAVGGGDVGPVEVALGMQVLSRGRPWRRVSRGRFVPRGAPAWSPVFVEWRREDGRWVVSSFGDVGSVAPPRVLGRGAGSVSPDTTLRLPPPDTLRERWYAENLPITFQERRYVKYGVVRTLAEHELTRVGTLGRLGVYVEAGSRGPADYLYVKVGPAQYQPYTGMGSGPC